MVTVEHLLDRGRYAARASAAVAAQPREGVERTVERVMEWRELRRTRWRYPAADDCDERLTALVGPQDDRGFAEVWRAALGDLAERGLTVGRGAFGGWDDADPRLGALAWWLTRRLRPEVVVETGVARGLTTRVVLEALERDGRGHLWSIDLPPLIDDELSAQIAAAVPERLHHRWTLLEGSSRRRLRGLTSRLPLVDLFVHDSMHTTRNVRFELETVWPALPVGGAVLIDDVQRNRATGEFLRAHDDAAGVICSAHDGAALIGVLVKRGRHWDRPVGHSPAARREAARPPSGLAHVTGLPREQCESELHDRLRRGPAQRTCRATVASAATFPAPRALVTGAGAASNGGAAPRGWRSYQPA